MIGQVVAGRYSLVRLLGDGGMGAVYKAEDNVLRRFVAIKLLHPAAAANPAAVERFLREAQSAASIGHPNIIEILDFGESEGKPYLVMEYLRGRSLAEVLHAEGPQSIRHACVVATHALAGLQAAHDRGVLHRDLKPANMMIVMRFGDRSFVKLLDFGFAALVGSAQPGDRNLTPARTLVGTPAYAPPERLRGDDRRDPRTDLYSLGVVLYEMLAGVRPFEAGTFSELARRVQHDPPPGLRMFRPDVPEALERVILRALAKKPDDRFANAEAFANALVPFGGRAVENDDGSNDSLAMDLLKIRARDKKRDPTGQVDVDSDSAALDLQRLQVDVDRTPPKRTSARESIRESPRESIRESDPKPTPRSERKASEASRSAALPPPTARAIKAPGPPLSPALPRSVDAHGIPPIAGPELPRPPAPPPPLRSHQPAPVPPTQRSFEGTLALSVLRFVSSRYGERALTAVMSRLRPETRKLFEAGIQPGHWLPFDAVCQLVETIDAALGRDDLHIIADCGRAVAEGAFDKLKQKGPIDPPPELLLAEMPRFVESLIRGIVVRLKSVGRGYGRLELDEQGASPSLTMCVLVLGFLDRCLTRFGATEVEVNLLACRYLGDDDNIFDISWLVM
ncbi:MAG TPA: serine/threonine-protein kinase [Polyangiales bacterium]